MSFQDNKFDIERVRKLAKDSRYIDNCKIGMDVLEDIYNDYYVASIGELETIKNEVIAVLSKELPERVHSLRGRVKHPDHLVEKIVRNTSENPGKYSVIDANNYNKIITDLVGVRIIILDKRDWRDVHNCLLKLFHNNPKYYVRNEKDYAPNYDRYRRHAEAKKGPLATSYILEKPVVYITTKDDRELYDDANLVIDESKSQYRSIHYVIRYGKVIFEIQVRTLFEEGWLEFDHRYNYPCDRSNEKKREFISVLSSMAQASDRLISFYDESIFEQKIRSKKKNDVKKTKKPVRARTYEDTLINRY